MSWCSFVVVPPVSLVRYSRQQVQDVIDALGARRFNKVLKLGRRSGSSGVVEISDEEGGAGQPPRKKTKHDEQGKRLKKGKSQYRGLRGVQDEHSLSLGFQNAAELAVLKETLLLNGQYTLRTVSR
jgi:hypothetical protein